MTPGTERDFINNQKRMIRELKRIADALEVITGKHKTTLAEYIGNVIEGIDEGDTDGDHVRLIKKDDAG